MYIKSDNEEIEGFQEGSLGTGLGNQTNKVNGNTSKEISANFGFVDWKKKYGITIMEDRSIYGPDRPAQYSKTPEFTYNDTDESILETEKQFLSEYFGKPFSVYEHQEIILSIVDKIVQEVINDSYKKFANIIIMEKNDFEHYKESFSEGVKKDRGISGDFHGINLGGLIIIQDAGGDSCFPLLFHEIGHNLYPDEHNNYLDEFRAMYFQILCTKKLEAELVKIGVNMSYPDNYYKDTPLPSKDHRKAFDDARVLFTLQSHYDMIVKGNEKYEKILQSFLKKVKQSQKSFK